MKYTLRILLLVTTLLVAVVPAWSDGKGAVSAITSSELKTLIDSSEQGVLIVDSRSNDEYQEAHIRGAVNIPLHTQESSNFLATHDKLVKVIFYCNGFA